MDTIGLNLKTLYADMDIYVDKEWLDRQSSGNFAGEEGDVIVYCSFLDFSKPRLAKVVHEGFGEAFCIGGYGVQIVTEWIPAECATKKTKVITQCLSNAGYRFLKFENRIVPDKASDKKLRFAVIAAEPKITIN